MPVIFHHRPDAAIGGPPLYRFFFFNDTATTEIYTLSLHDALPISVPDLSALQRRLGIDARVVRPRHQVARSEEHTSELQSLAYLVCRLLLEKKKKRPSSAAASPSG